MSQRIQFSLKGLFVAMLVVAAFFAGIRFERERRRREDEAAMGASVLPYIEQSQTWVPVPGAKWKDKQGRLLPIR